MDRFGGWSPNLLGVVQVSSPPFSASAIIIQSLLDISLDGGPTGWSDFPLVGEIYRKLVGFPTGWSDSPHWW